ncbi:MAG: ThiF family adenylyltransferase [Pirellulaceae bacterium]|nr:ThiF family adenylyltransferase [Planctomycetales bacterium]
MTNPDWIIGDDRYERLRLIAWWDQEKLARAKVLVVGAGALGNEVLKNLALLGIGHIYVIDFDRIETSNLTRAVLFRHRDCGRSKAETAAAALVDLNPDCRVTGWEADVINDVGLGLVREVDVIIGCLDNREARLWVNRLSWKAGVPWIDGGIQEINGVVKVFQPPNSACYECGMTENDYRLINLRYSCPLLKRDDILAGRVPTAPTISSIIAGVQTQEALKLLHGLKVDAGSILVFNGATNQSYTTAIQRKEDCLSHESWGDPIASGLSAETHRVSDLLNWAGETYGGDSWVLHLDRDLVVAMACPECGQRQEQLRPMSSLSVSQGHCSNCGQMMVSERVHRIDKHDRWGTLRLRQAGIPLYDIVRLTDAERELLVLLDGDRRGVMVEGIPLRGAI